MPRLRAKTVAAIPGVGAIYGVRIRAWQREAQFAADIAFADTDVVDDARAILGLSERIAGLDARIEALQAGCRAAQRLRSIPGFGATGVGELVGEIGTLGRFRGESSLAVYLGMAPLDHSSGLRVRGKRPRCINVRCQAAMMTCVVRHKACVPESQAFYDRKRAQGKTHNQAVRALGRHLVRAIWHMLKDDRDYEARVSAQAHTA